MMKNKTEKDITKVDKEQNKILSRRKYLFLMIMGIVFCFGISYALFSEVLTGKKNFVLESSGLKIYLDETNTAKDIVIQNAIPTLDRDGIQTESYKFSLVNEEKQDLDYVIYLKEDEYTNKTPSNLIRYHYTRDVDSVDVIRNVTDNQTEDGRYFIEKDTISSGKTYNYSLQMWIDYNAGNEILNTKYSAHIEIEAIQTSGVYKEAILRGTEPVLTDNLIPVKIGDSGTVRKADLYDEWYNYEKKIWANAIVLKDKSINYKEGQVIPEENIESYFVWIPRYKYKLFSTGNYTGNTNLSDTAVQTIEVVFENKNTKVSGGTEKGEWHSHPAFQAFDTNGFWVAKFESGYREASSTATAEVNAADATKLIIKPNTYSWRNITVGNAFKACYDYMRDEESHMMKNTEWGAVAYLSHSIYGKNSEIYINNNSSYLTGCGGDSASEGPNATCKNAYGSKDDGIYNQTTTGNISGVFDMSGGAWEYVMGYNTSASTVGGSSGITSLYADFFDNHEWDKYCDKYTSGSDTAYNNRILGDATGEMGPFASNRSSWYSDYAYFVNSSYPWIGRGGLFDNTSLAGGFFFSNNAGDNRSNRSFRITLFPR